MLYSAVIMVSAMTELIAALIPPDPGELQRLAQDLEELEDQLQELHARLTPQTFVTAKASSYLSTSLENLGQMVTISKPPSSRRMSPRDKSPKSRSRHFFKTGNQCLVPSPPPHAMSAAAPRPSHDGPRWQRPPSSVRLDIGEDLYAFTSKGTTSSPGLGPGLVKKVMSTSRLFTLDDGSSYVSNFAHVDLLSLQDNHHHVHDGPQPTRSPKWIDAFTLSSVDMPASPSSESTENVQHDPLPLRMSQAWSDNTLTDSGASPIGSISKFLFWICHNCSDLRQPDGIHLL